MGLFLPVTETRSGDRFGAPAIQFMAENEPNLLISIAKSNQCQQILPIPR